MSPDYGNGDDRFPIRRRSFVTSGIGAALVGSSLSMVSAATDSQSIRIEGMGTPTRYHLSVSGDLRVDHETTEAASVSSGSHADGTVTDEVHAYRYRGELTDLRVDGGARLFLSGGRPGGSAFGPPGSIRLVRTGGPTNYAITASGNVAPASATTEDVSDTISGRNAEGTLADRPHRYRFDGAVTNVRVDGDAVIYVNGDEAFA